MSGLGFFFHLVALKLGENSKNHKHNQRSGKNVLQWDSKMLVYLPWVQGETCHSS